MLVLRRKPIEADIITGPSGPLEFLPQLVQRAPARSLSLEASGPHMITATAQARGAWCWHRSHHSQTQGVDRCSSGCRRS